MKQKLIIHQANDHVTEMAFNCEICLKGFVGKVSLDRHQKNMHKNEKKFKCYLFMKMKSQLNVKFAKRNIEVKGC